MGAKYKTFENISEIHEKTSHFFVNLHKYVEKLAKLLCFKDVLIHVYLPGS
jgi:hypothetical protein